MPSLPAPVMSSRRLILPALNASKKSFALSLMSALLGCFLHIFVAGSFAQLSDDQRPCRSLIGDQSKYEPARQYRFDRFDLRAAAGDGHRLLATDLVGRHGKRSGRKAAFDQRAGLAEYMAE